MRRICRSLFMFIIVLCLLTTSACRVLPAEEDQSGGSEAASGSDASGGAAEPGKAGETGESGGSTDSQDTVFTLEVPPFSLSEEMTITMTPFADITEDGQPSFALGGVRLEPDGLRFLTPARMKVAPADASIEPLLLTGTSDGGDLQPVIAGDAFRTSADGSLRDF